MDVRLWGQHFLLGERVGVGWQVLLPGAVATILGLTGLRWFSYQIFSPLIVTNAITYGAVGAVLVVQSWLAHRDRIRGLRGAPDESDPSLSPC